jgi:hypothetical protein
MPDTTHRVQAIVDRFVSELTQVAREEARRLVLAGFGAPKSERLTNGSTVRPSRTSRANGSHRPSGSKRSPESLQALEEKVRGFIASHPGLRIEEINQQLSTKTSELALPLRKLIAARRVKTTGQKRSTKYFAGSARESAAAKPASTTKVAKRTATSKRRRRSKR